MNTFPIYHPEHGQATADEHTDLAQFEAAGWSQTKTEAKTEKTKAEKTKV